MTRRDLLRIAGRGTAAALVGWFPVWHGVQWGQLSLLLLLLLSGVLLAVRSVVDRPGLTVGLGPLLS